MEARLPERIAVLGAGNLGQAMTTGWLNTGQIQPEQITMSRHRTSLLSAFQQQGVQVTADNVRAIAGSSLLILAVKPFKVREVMEEIAPHLLPEQVIVSVATGISIADIRQWCPESTPVFRAMPNTAIAIGESLTCLVQDNRHPEHFQTLEALFDLVGRSVEISEDLMNAATVLGACGVAYALRFVRAMQQGGIEIGFDAHTAALIANQTVRGAASLLLTGNHHAEAEIDKVTTPKGCTIAGLNEMEHQGFSSSLIKGILTSYGRID